MKRIIKKRFEKLFVTLLTALLAVCMLAACSPKKGTAFDTSACYKTKLEPSAEETNYVQIEIENSAYIVVELYPVTAPITVANFKKLVKEDFYNGTIFHRVIKGFMIQGGDPEGTGYGGSKDKIKGEFSSNGVKNDLKHTRGVISMARTQDPNSASSQFFIMHADAPHLDGNYAAFGKVVAGLETVDAIANLAVQDAVYNRPVIDVHITGMEFVNYTRTPVKSAED